MAVTAVFAASNAMAAPKEAGVWIDDTGKGAVKIEPCGKDALCGRIVWLRDPLNAQGEPLTDKNNPDAGKRKRSICGLATLGDLKPSPDGGYDFGWVYDPKVGKSYTVAIALKAPDKLQVTGYLGMKFLGKSFFWTRADGDLPSCDKETKADAVPPKVAPKPTATGAAAVAPAAAVGVKKAAAAPAKAEKAKAKASAAGETLPWATETPAASKKVAKPIAKPTTSAAAKATDKPKPATAKTAAKPVVSAKPEQDPDVSAPAQ